MSKVNYFILLAAGLLLSVLVMSSCKKDPVNVPLQPVAGFMAFNLAADKPNVGFAISGTNLTNTAIGFTGYTGAYVSIYTGNREVQAYDFSSGTTISSQSADFRDSSYNSGFLLGNNGVYRTIVVEDKLIPLTATTGKAWVRYVNAIADTLASPIVTVSSNGDNTINEPASFARVSEFQLVNAGPITIDVTDGAAISTIRTITVEENKIYTLLLVGVPNETDPTKIVQVKYIQNGQLNP